MGAMKELLEDIKEEMGDDYYLLAAEEDQAALIAAGIFYDENLFENEEIIEDDTEVKTECSVHNLR